MELTQETKDRIYANLMDDAITLKAGTSEEVVELCRYINSQYPRPRYNLTVAEGKKKSYSNTGLASTLPKDARIREELLAQLRKRFGEERIAVCGNAVVVVDPVQKLEHDWQNAPSVALHVMADKVLVFFDPGDRFDFSGLKPDEEKICRFVLEEPTNVKALGEWGFSASRKTSAGEFFVYSSDDVANQKIRFRGFVPLSSKH
ncbi:MAG: hypothetical protein E7037_01635 [Verrucomicrobia bacterium]|nr:hypothetical protein [Verrucomicrobiota bacterium]